MLMILVLISSSASGLRKHLYTLQEYSTKWKLEVNTDKTKVCVFGKDTDGQAITWKNITLEKVTSYKYLGIWMCKNGKFNKTCNYLSNQAKKASFALLTILHHLNHPPIRLALKLYNCMVAPIMCYASEIWGFTEEMNLERVELGFLKAILNISLSTPNMAVLGELGHLPIYLWWKEKILKFWDRLCNQDSPKLLRMAIQLSFENFNRGKRSWVGNAAAIFNNAGHSFSATISGCDNEQRNEIMCAHRDQFIQRWHSNLAREHSIRGNGETN